MLTSLFVCLTLCEMRLCYSFFRSIENKRKKTVLLKKEKKKKLAALPKLVIVMRVGMRKYIQSSGLIEKRKQKN